MILLGVVCPIYSQIHTRDYGNLNYAGESNGPSMEEVINRKEKPRMPWHDVHMMVDGLAARGI